MTADTMELDGDITRREIYFFNLYRCLQAVVYIGLVFSPYAFDWVRLTHPMLGRATALVYLVIALGLLLATDHLRARPRLTIGMALVGDILAASLIAIALAGGSNSVPMMLIVNIGIAALLLPLNQSLTLAGLAAFGMTMPPLFVQIIADEKHSGDIDVWMFAVAYFAVTVLCNQLGRSMRATEALAEQRGVDLLNLEQINDLIIRRMRTGVLLVDEANNVLRINEAAWNLIGNPSPNETDLGAIAPELSRRLYHWRRTRRSDQTAVALAADVPQVIPRFTRLAPNDDAHVLIFLDDTSLLSRRAEELTLNSLGRLSASIAHEIRNPLAAIRYSAQLLGESPDLDEGDRRLAEIINNHCTRANDVVENILQLSRRERSRPESLDLNSWVLAFVEAFKRDNDLGDNQLRGVTQNHRIEALADPQHLEQVLWNLVQNALRYGRQPDEPARVVVATRLIGDLGTPLLEVIDRGPGIPAKIASQIFEPFYTTHEFGTGLGLYLARQMCEANQATLEYIPLAGGGACFRIGLTPAASLSRAHGTSHTTA